MQSIKDQTTKTIEEMTIWTANNRVTRIL